MGRSGGGHHRSGGGGFRSHSHHYHSYRRNRGYRSSGGGGNSSIVIILFVTIFIIGVTSIIAVTLANDIDDNTQNTPELSPKEQFLWCGDRETKVKYTSSKIRVYESVNGTPAMSADTREISKSFTGYLSNSYRYESFFVAPGSTIKAEKSCSSTSTDFIVIKGWKQMEEFMDDDYYTYIHRSNSDTFELSIQEFDEYFVVIDGKRTTKCDVEIDVTLATYDTTDLPERCTSHGPSCTLNKDGNDDFCIVIDYDVESSPGSIYRNVKVTIDDGTGSEVSITTIVAITICAILVVVVIIAAVRVIAARVKTRMNEMAAENEMDFSAHDVPMDDPEVETKASMVDTDVSYPAGSPSDIPSAIISNNDYTSPVAPYPSAPEQYPAGPSAYAGSDANAPAGSNIYPTIPPSY